MVKADQKKADNISEYLIYMFQSEDLIRTFEFDLNRITEYMITNIPVTDSEKKELILWYAALIENMRTDKVEKTGHITEVNNLIEELTILHLKLIRSDNKYAHLAQSAKPFIQSNIKKSNNTVNNPIQICLNAIYGFLLLKFEEKTITNEQQKMLNSFGDLLSYLSFIYKEQNLS
ncbi:hypothetical protein MNBD_BACTEROID06-1190 [hydrothermal vent metagenome]|uniref:DUF4924 domain-containing protein n=1 Tax=hydrothermal vent metagenome TaxID=652676 RepID=A0A3B0UHS1_9ZZZZ